ncbi:MAG: hypothetical protein ABR971_04050, partial [Acidobacteriaceae bacterium]
IALAAALSVFALAAILIHALWLFALHCFPFLTHALIHWLALLAAWLLCYAHWLQRWWRFL